MSGLRQRLHDGQVVFGRMVLELFTSGIGSRHFDLTVSIGIPARFENPRFLEAMSALVACCRRHGVAPGFLPATPAAAARGIRKGFRAITLGSHIGVFLHAMRTFRQALIDTVPELIPVEGAKA